MAAGFDWLAQAGVQNVEAQAAHKRQLQDEQRQSKEAALQSQLNSGAITAGQYGQGLNDLYAHEPAESRLGRIGRGLERAVGLKKQAAAQKAQADAKLAAKPSPRRDFAQIEAGAKSPEQLAGEAATAKTEAEIQGVQSTWQAFQRMAKDLPPDQRSQLEALFGGAAHTQRVCLPRWLAAAVVRRQHSGNDSSGLAGDCRDRNQAHQGNAGKERAVTHRLRADLS